MTGRFTLSPRAQADLSDIWDYTVDRWGVDQAETYTRALRQSIEAIAANPSMGEDCSNSRTML
jgi:toxin ParE1/3/4